MVSYLIICLLSIQIFIHIYLLKVRKYLIFYLKQIMSTFDLFFLGYVHSDFGIVFDSKKKKKILELYTLGLVCFHICWIKVWFFFFFFFFYINFIVILSFNFEYCSSPSFTFFFFVVSSSRIQIYYILDL